MAAFDSNSPSAGVLACRFMGMYTPIVSPKLRASGLCTIAAHCVHNPCGAFHKKGGLTGAMGVDVFSGRPGRLAVTLLLIMLRASSRAGPQGQKVAALRVAYSYVNAAWCSKRSRNLDLASGFTAPSRVASRSNLAASVIVSRNAALRA